MGPLAILQDRLDFWRQWWHREKGPTEELAAALQEVRRAARAEANERDAYTGAQLARVIGRTRKGRGLGCDHWSPAELGQLPQCAIDDLAADITEAERMAAAPAQALLNIIALLDKPQGGDRPICLASMWCVLWSSLAGAGAFAWDRGAAAVLEWRGGRVERAQGHPPAASAGRGIGGCRRVQ